MNDALHEKRRDARRGNHPVGEAPRHARHATHIARFRASGQRSRARSKARSSARAGYWIRFLSPGAPRPEQRGAGCAAVAGTECGGAEPGQRVGPGARPLGAGPRAFILSAFTGTADGARSANSRGTPGALGFPPRDPFRGLGVECRPEVYPIDFFMGQTENEWSPEGGAVGDDAAGSRGAASRGGQRRGSDLAEPPLAWWRSSRGASRTRPASGRRRAPRPSEAAKAPAAAAGAPW